VSPEFLKRLEEERIEFRRAAGTSAGSITATLIAAGYKATDKAIKKGLLTERGRPSSNYIAYSHEGTR